MLALIASALVAGTVSAQLQFEEPDPQTPCSYYSRSLDPCARTYHYYDVNCRTQAFSSAYPCRSDSRNCPTAAMRTVIQRDNVIWKVTGCYRWFFDNPTLTIDCHPVESNPCVCVYWQRVCYQEFTFVGTKNLNKFCSPSDDFCKPNGWGQTECCWSYNLNRGVLTAWDYSPTENCTSSCDIRL